MKRGGGWDERRVIRQRGREREFRKEGTKTRNAGCFRVTMIQRNNKPMAFTGSVNESVVALVLFDVVEISKRFAEK